MADTELLDLSSRATLALTDEFYVVDSAAGTPADWRATLTALVTLLRTSGMLPQTIVAAADDSDADNTLHDDPELSFSVVANAVYTFEAHLFFTTGTSNTVDVNFNWTIPASATMTWLSDFLVSTATTVVALIWKSQYRTTDLAGAGVLSTATQPVTPVVLKGVVKTGATAGTVQLQFAQDVTTGGTPIVRKADSWLRYTRVA